MIGDDETETTRERILRIAAALFRRRGYYGTSMRDLAVAVGITKSSLYHHFPSKQALLSRIVGETVDRATPALREVASSDLEPGERLRRAVALHVVELIRDIDNQACYLQEGRYLEPREMETFVAKRDRYEAYFRQILEDGVASGDFRAVDVRLAVLAVLGMCNWVYRWYRADGERSPAEIGEMLADFAVRSVARDGPTSMIALGLELEQDAP